MSQWYHRLFAATPANGAGMKTYALVDRHFVAKNPIQYSTIQYPITSPLLGTDWTVNALLRLRSVGTYDPHSLWNDWYFVNFEPFGSPKLAGIIANRIAMPSAATTVRDFFFRKFSFRYWYPWHMRQCLYSLWRETNSRGMFHSHCRIWFGGDC